MSEFYFFREAIRLNRSKHEYLKELQCHFRGSFGGTSLISLHQETPELGVTQVNTRELEAAFNKIRELLPPQRVTPEKKLQAALINDILFGTPPVFWKDLNLTFLTSELRLTIPNEIKDSVKNNVSITNDILAIDSNGALWIIELKSKRELKELCRQLSDYTKVILGQKEKVKELVKILSSNQCSWDGKSFCKMIIWPKRASKTTQGELRSHDVFTIRYSGKDQFEYEVEVGDE